MTDFQRVVIVGVGLLGGSIGKALRQRRRDAGSHTVVGVGRDASRLDRAIELGAIDECFTEIEPAVAGADLVVVCTPVKQIVPTVRKIAQSADPSVCITDVGSTKGSICSELDQLGIDRFCGSHPLAGSDKSGVENASTDLFESRTTVLTPTQETSRELENRLAAFWQHLGSRTVRMSPQEHDDAIARTSHLPHLVASALAASTPSELLPLAATGWCDTTRVAAGNVDLWSQICQENKAPILAALQRFAGDLDEWIEALQTEETERLETLLARGKQKRDSLGN